MSPLPASADEDILDMALRQTRSIKDSSITPNSCITYVVSGPGYFQANDSFYFNFTQDATLEECGANATIGDNDYFLPTDPYFASTSPVLFVLGVCVTVAWILLLMLLMTPRTYLTGGGASSRRPDAGINVVGVGNRPWFQKVATLFVAIALLIATANTFADAEGQYDQRYQNSVQLTIDVFGSLEIRAIRFVSTLFEWLAQAQTALRLFPRHRERIAIKWIALSLILLEMIFGIINGFTKLGQDYEDEGYYIRPRQRTAAAFPALQYLFELALSLMYAGCIAYYALTKRRYAFYHPDMWNISVVALLSITAVLVPVVFFVLDIAVPNIAAWGDYVRWVGAAAASVVVWEWVERIEALEREERKDGILGREIFEGDDALGGDSASGKRSRRRREGQEHSDAESPVLASSGTDSSVNSSLKKTPAESNTRYRRVSKDVLRRVAAIRMLAKNKATKSGLVSKDVELKPISGAVRRRAHRDRATNGPQMPPVDPMSLAQTSSSPVSRSDCTSASTVYRVTHHTISPSSTPGISETLGYHVSSISPVEENPNLEAEVYSHGTIYESDGRPHERLSAQSQTIPPEIIAQQARAEQERAANTNSNNKSGRGFLSRLRFSQSQPKELPELVIPWRGNNGVSSQHDPEAGHEAQDTYDEDAND